MADDWTPRPDLVGTLPDPTHPLFQRDGASVVECRSRVADGVEVLQGSVRWYKRQGTSDFWVHEIFGAFLVPTALPVLLVERKRRLGLPSKRDGEFPVERFDEMMRVDGDAALAARLLTGEVRAWIAEHLHHTKWSLTIGGRWVTVGTGAGVFGNDDTALHVARLAWSLHQLAGAALTQAAAGRWAADPFGRHEQRWWDGEAWTEHVADAGVAAVDPPVWS